jgi:hypothetical protein
MTILEACRDPNLFGKWFRHGKTWNAWFAFLAAAFAIPLDDDQLETFRKHTGRDRPPEAQVREAWLVCGRRAGKSFILALIATFLAGFYDYRRYLQPGERAVILVIAHDQRQARVIMNYVRGFLTHIPMLKRMVSRETATAFDLNNASTIEISTASYRTVRGYTLVAVLCDEIAFWPTDDAAEPDREILNAVRPGLATIPSSMLLAASSPYARRGELWRVCQQHFRQQDDEILVWKATTREMNPAIPQRTVDRELERDPTAAAAEWLAEFRSDVESYISREAIEACTTDALEHAPRSGLQYAAFADPSGGQADSFTLAIAHRQDGCAVLDAIREAQPPFSPEGVVAEYAHLLHRYGIRSIQSDRYAGQWPVEAFRRHGITCVQSARPKSDLYRDLLPAINSREITLLRHPRLQHQLATLERRTARGGRDSIDHAPGAHDDVCNAVAGALVLALKPSRNRATHLVITGYGCCGEIRPARNDTPKVRAWYRRI